MKIKLGLIKYIGFLVGHNYTFLVSLFKIQDAYRSTKLMLPK